MSYQFLLYSSMNQMHVYLNLAPQPHPTLPGRHRAPSWVCGTGASHQLSSLHVVVYVRQFYSLDSSHPLLPPLCLQVSQTAIFVITFLPACSSISTPCMVWFVEAQRLSVPCALCQMLLGKQREECTLLNPFILVNVLQFRRKKGKL